MRKYRNIYRRKMKPEEIQRRLKEAKAKVQKVYLWDSSMGGVPAVTTADMVAVEKILDKCLKRLG